MSSSETQLYVDRRIQGDYGIGRLSREVIDRLTLPYRAFEDGRNPLSARDALNARRLVLPSTSLLYTPGFNAGLGRCRQLITLCDLIHLQLEASPARRALWRAYYQQIVRPAVRRAQHVVTISQASAVEIREWLNDDSVTVHNFGIGLSSAFLASHTDAPGREEFYLFVGNSKPHKNLRVVLEAMARLPDARLVAVVPDRSATSDLVARYGLGGRVSLRSGLSDEDLVSLYRRCRALIYPSSVEGFGLPVAEALACGADVVFYSECASVVEIARGSGISMPSLDPNDWAEAMKIAGASVGGDPSAYARRYSWDRTASRVQDLLSNLTS